MKDRIFVRGDWRCGALAAFVAFIVYAWTTAPSVTLLDSGEFLVAAQHFGVPHPTGYPLWTMLGGLFLLIPLGNAAWQLALLSGIWGALCVGLAAMLIRSTARWIAPGAHRPLDTIAALSLSLTFAFSQSMWSQAVIVEVYTLHALLIGLYLTGLYVWLRRPERMAPLYWSIFLFSLAFSNHQLTLALAGLPMLVVLLVRRDLFWDLFLAAAVSALIAYLSFALLADNPSVIKASVRLAYLVGTIFVIALLLKRGRLQWKIVAFVPMLIALGLLPYAYMPIASSTNPPMNWGYTRTAEGFFYSFNRTQYSGSLSDLSLRLFSKTLGVAKKDDFSEPAPSKAPKTSWLGDLQAWSAFFWTQLFLSFTPLGILFFFAAFAGALRVPLAIRVWIYLLVVAFCLAMALEPLLAHARIDNAGWWVQMPYHTYTNFLFALVAGVGAFMSLRALERRRPRLRVATWALLVLPLWPLWRNADTCSQRDHWFGWRFGRDIVDRMPPGGVLFGGSDPGRFIPTYLIFGESTLPPNRRIDPHFDRSDLYIITQNALTDRYYLAYLRDHYSAARPAVTTAFERWLGRDHTYPREPLILPTQAQMSSIAQEAQKIFRAKTDDFTRQELVEATHSAVAEWIFKKNRDRHTFYVEEAFPMMWSYDYAIPDGLVYRLSPSPLAKLPADVVEKDFAFWADYIARLKANPIFAADGDAQHTFSRLRLTTATIYYHRKMWAEAELAYRQALDLWPSHLNVLIPLASILWDQRKFDEVIALFDRARAEDPNSPELLKYRRLAETRKETQEDIDRTLEVWRKNPPDLTSLRRLIELNSQIGESDAVDALLREAIAKLGNRPDFLQLVVEVSEARNDWPSAADAATRLTQFNPHSAESFYHLARAQTMLNQAAKATAALKTAIQLGGPEFRDRLFRDPVFEKLKETPAFRPENSAPSRASSPDIPAEPPANPALTSPAPKR